MKNLLVFRGGGIPLNEISSWDDLVTKINDDTTTTEFIIMNDLTATSTITVSKQVKIISDEEVTITRGNSSDGGNFEDSFFSVESAGNLELGSEENKIILDGGNANESPILATAPLITSSGNLTLTNCTLQNNTLNSTVPDFGNGGAVYVSGGTFTMNSLGTISYCKANNGGAVYVSGGTFNMNGGTITECSATDSGGGVWMNGGSSIWGIVGSSFTMSGDSKIVNCNSYSEGGGVYVTDSSNLCTFKMLDNATITSCNAENNGGGVSYGCGLKGTFEISGNAKINSNISSYCGGGIYLYGLLTMNGGTISDNKATVSGAGVYLSDSTSSFTMNGGAYVDSSNDVYLASGTTVTVAGELTSNTTPVATITPFEYTVGTQVLTADDNNLLEKSVDKFALTQSADGTKYEINTDGKLVLVSQNYAEGLTYIGSSTDSPGTLYISSAKGLATFRNIVNGSFESDIIVKYQDNTNSAYTFFAGISQLNINAVLENDIDLKNESWTPIGNSSSDKTYEGTFDGAKYEIKGLNINSSDTNPIGLFGSIKGGTVKNLVVQGSITSSYFTGGITGYLNGGTIENCVNNVEITNSAVNGTGGIVGYVASDGGTIQNCINLVSVTGGNSVGGIVGGAGPSSFPTIKKCINIGDIKASSGIASGIYGYATTSSSSSSSILDCINLGSINGNYACGIVYNSEGYTSVSNCINIGSLTGTSVHAIANSSSGTYSNNYYDSTKITNYDKEGITGKSTSDLIGSNISLDGISDDDQWSFAEGRYLLPNIAENIPDQIWATVEVAAISDSSSVSGGDSIV